LKWEKEDKMNSKFNIIGFWDPPSSPWRPTLHCVIHPGSKLVHMEGEDPSILRCVHCGSVGYKKDEALTEERIKAKHNKQQTRIITPKKSKKHYDKQGNEINDEQLLKDIANGAHVISYREDKVPGDSNKPKYHVVRR
jgi:hypothetical protein